MFIIETMNLPDSIKKLWIEGYSGGTEYGEQNHKIK